MTKACDFCPRLNQFICNPEDHCLLCPKGQRATQEPESPEDEDDLDG